MTTTIGARTNRGLLQGRVVSECGFPSFEMLLTILGQRGIQANRTTSEQVDKLAQGIKKSQSIHV